MSFQTSGLSKLIGDQIAAYFSFLSLDALVILLSLISVAINEVLRASATATIILPVAARLGESLHVNPLKLIIPVTISCAYAFVLPVGTTATALTYDHANLKISDLVKSFLVFC